MAVAVAQHDGVVVAGREFSEQLPAGSTLAKAYPPPQILWKLRPHELVEGLAVAGCEVRASPGRGHAHAEPREGERRKKEFGNRADVKQREDSGLFPARLHSQS